MTANPLTVHPPLLGDVFLRVEMEHYPIELSLLQKFWRWASRQSSPPTHQVATLHFRKVIDVTPSCVFYITPERDQLPELLMAAWSSEWWEWADRSVRIFHQGELISEGALLNFCGGTLDFDLPFDLAQILEINRDPDRYKVGGTD